MGWAGIGLVGVKLDEIDRSGVWINFTYMPIFLVYHLLL